MSFAPERTRRRIHAARRLTITMIVSVGMVVAAATPALAKTVPAKKWAKSVCHAVADWSTGIGDALADSDSAATNAATVQATLLDSLEQARSETDALLDALKKAGTPRVKRGAAVAKAIRAGYDDVLAAITAAHSAVESAPTTDAAAFVRTATAALDELEQSLSAGQDTLAESRALRTAPLGKAFDQRVCRAVLP